MTDVPSMRTSVPGRLGLTAEMHDGVPVLGLVPHPHTLHHGVVRVSVLAFLVDVAAGLVADDDPDRWALTSDMSVRMRPMAAPERIEAVNTVLRRGQRSVTCRVDLTSDVGPVATGAIGFVRLARRDRDPVKPTMSAERLADVFPETARLSRPLREEAGIEVVDAAAGIVQLEVTEALRNPAGTLQGAMVALVAESAAEDLLSARSGVPVVMVDLDLRYLAQAHVGPVRTACRLLGDGPGAPVEVELIDTSTDRVTTLVYARGVPARPEWQGPVP